MRRSDTGMAATLALVLLPLAGCATGQATVEGRDRELTVLAAASLTGVFTELAEVFEADHAGVRVRLTFDSSAALAHQAAEGAPADVLATADTTTMDDAVGNGATAAPPVRFALNTLVLATPSGNPRDVTGLGDLSGTDWVMCVETAPCGRAAAAVLGAAGVPTDPVSLEVDVKAVLAKVAADEADAGLVFATDALAAGDSVESFALPGTDAEPATYQVAPLRQAGAPDLARSWVALLTSDTGRRVLRAAGFGMDP